MNRTNGRASDRHELRARSISLFAVTFFALTLLALATVGCSGGESTTTTAGTLPGGTQPSATGYTNITPAQLAEMLKSKDFVFVNTHVPYEGEIEQTDLFIDYQRAAELVSELPADKNAKIVVYCRSDRMSTIAVEEWAKAGYTNLYNLEGGFAAWKDAGYELLMKQQ